VAVTDGERVLGEVKHHFLHFRENLRSVCKHGNVEIYVPADDLHKAKKKRDIGTLFVNGVAVTWSQPLYLSYNFEVPDGNDPLRLALDRDHKVTDNRKFCGPIFSALKANHEKLKPHIPDAPTCELAQVFFPPNTDRAASGSPAASKAASPRPSPEREPAASRRQSPSAAKAAPSAHDAFMKQLKDLSLLQPPPEPKRTPASIKELTKEVNKLILDFSRDDPKPEKHRTIVGRVSNVLKVRAEPRNHRRTPLQLRTLSRLFLS
jgi:hypothetical protein